MGCGESKHAVATENTTIPKNKRSLSSKSNSTKAESQENVKIIENGESGVAETVKTAEKVEAADVIAPKVVAKEEAKVEMEKVKEELKTEGVVVEKKEEKVVVQSQPEEKKKIGNEKTTPAVVAAADVVEKKESAEEIKAEEKTGMLIVTL